MTKPGLRVERIARRFMDAVRNKDVTFLERHLGEEFTLTTGRAGAEVRARDEWLAITRDSYAIETFEFEELEVREYGHVAVVHSRYRQVATMDGADRSGTYLMTDVWVRRRGDWVLVTRHASPLDG